MEMLRKEIQRIKKQMKENKCIQNKYIENKCTENKCIECNTWSIIWNTKYRIQCIEKKPLNAIHKLQCTVCNAYNTIS